jgi:serine/threonine protein phosphatase 1
MMMRRLRRIFASDSPIPTEPPTFALPSGMRIYAVGDVHGRSTLLAKMLAAIAADAAANPATTTIEVFLGDYIDRGMHSREVIDMLLAPPVQGHTRICLLGNHEDVLLRFLEEPSILREWGNFGGYATLASYGIGIPESMTPQALADLRDRFKQHFPAQHAGVLPKLPLAEQSRDDLLWIRQPFLQHEGFFEQYVVHGHSPVAVPDIRVQRANLDVSAAAVPSLCCLVIEDTQRRILLVTDEKS